MQKVIFIVLLGLTALTACKNNWGNQPAYLYEAWKKNGASELEVKKALLECGFPDFTTGHGFGRLSANDEGSYAFCMEKAGFRTQSPVSNRCYTYKDENLAICKPGAVIPSRSVTKRLNGPYCKKWKGENLPVCQP